MQWSYLLLLPPTTLLVREDFRIRKVSVAWLATLGIVSIAVGCTADGLRPMLWNTATNAIITLLFCCCLGVWQIARHRPLQELFSTDLGAGDVCMMLTVTPVLSPTAYVHFMLISCLAGLAWWIVQRSATIPLAGFMALILAAYSISKTTGLWT